VHKPRPHYNVHPSQVEPLPHTLPRSLFQAAPERQFELTSAQLRRVVVEEKHIHFLVVAAYLALPQIGLAVVGGMVALSFRTLKSLEEV
jgi:hypothetical protein